MWERFFVKKLNIKTSIIRIQYAFRPSIHKSLLLYLFTLFIYFYLFTLFIYLIYLLYLFTLFIFFLLGCLFSIKYL